MYRIIAVLFAIGISFSGQAQFNNILKKAKNKVEQKADSRIDKEIDKRLDPSESKEPAVASTAESKQGSSAASEKAEQKQTIKSYSKFDFVPGEKIIYSEDFQQDAIGELPLAWNASGKGEIMTLGNQPGKWLRIFQNNTYLSGNKSKFGENYTIEFDLIYFFDPKVKGYVLPGWEFGIFSSGSEDASDNKFLKEQSALNSTEVRFGYGSYALAILESKKKRASGFISDKMQLGEVLPGFNKVVHYSVQVQKTRFRLWIDEKKVFDIPRAINTSDTLNQVYFKMEGSNYKEDEIGLYVTNLKIATGLPDTRHKLVEEGKFSTTGILFDVNAATIKPESNGVLKEVAEAIKSQPGMKIRIIGHTDSDGNDAANLELSRKRAEAVKAALEKDFEISSSQLETEGKGETKPVGDNKTKEGKAMNRRVEFVRVGGK